MPAIRVKGHEFMFKPIRDSFSRRAVSFSNKILFALMKLGIEEDDIEISEERMALRSAPAQVEWYGDGENCAFKYNKQKRFVDNLQVLSMLIETEVGLVIEGKKTFEQFIMDFAEDLDVEEKRKKARELLGVSHDCEDLDEISKKYKQLSKEAHPDMPNGNHDKFKEINQAHKLLRRELE